MRIVKAVALALLLAIFIPQIVLAQAFGEYGRGVGGATQRQGAVSSKPLSGVREGGQSKSGYGGAGNLGGRSLPAHLVVASKEAAVYPRQDDESEKIGRLSEGEAVVPLIQTNGGNDWYMVKTQQGLIGWVKASDVRTPVSRKQSKRVTFIGKNAISSHLA
jgi:hypothetical protein